MTKQEMFDKVVTHLVAQGVRASTGNDTYMYLTKDGNKCAIGCLMSEKELEKFKDYIYEVSELVHCGYKAPESLEFLSCLQDLHDNSSNWSDDKGFIGWKDAKNIAEFFDLEWKHLDVQG